MTKKRDKIDLLKLHIERQLLTFVRVIDRIIVALETEELESCIRERRGASFISEISIIYNDFVIRLIGSKRRVFRRKGLIVKD